MSVWNALPYVHEAVRSILDQTCRDFEFIVIDDGSTDGTGEALEHYDDTRLQVHRRQQNVGLTKRLNEAIRLARGKYIARMDADDVSHRERFEKQVAFLDAHPDVALVGTFCRSVQPGGRVEEWVYPTADERIRAEMVRRNPFVHGSVVMRRAALDAVGFYNESLRYVQDYDLWGRIAAKFQTANLPEFLVSRHERPNSITLSGDIAWARFRAHAAAQLSVIRSLNRPLAAIWLIEHVLWYAKDTVVRRFSSRSAS